MNRLLIISAKIGKVGLDRMRWILFQDRVLSTLRYIVMKKKRRIFFPWVIILGFVTGYAIIQGYLKFSDDPLRSAAIVLFVGSKEEQGDRLKEAHQLMYEGYAKTLLIPRYNEIFGIAQGKKNEDLNLSDFQYNKSTYPSYYENTHIEIICAKKTMEIMGFNSAILVSSPYHIRRIEMISRREFAEKKWKICFVASRYINKNRGFIVSLLDNMKQTLTEYIKIIGFYLYSFVESINFQSIYFLIK